MDNKRTERERKDLNKKLLQKTFVSELKSRRKEKFLEYVTDFIVIFIALFLSKFVVDIFSISLPIVEMAITVLIVMIMLFIGSLLRNHKVN